MLPLSCKNQQRRIGSGVESSPLGLLDGLTSVGKCGLRVRPSAIFQRISPSLSFPEPVTFTSVHAADFRRSMGLIPSPLPSPIFPSQVRFSEERRGEQAKCLDSNVLYFHLSLPSGLPNLKPNELSLEPSPGGKPLSLTSKLNGEGSAKRRLAAAAGKVISR